MVKRIAIATIGTRGDVQPYIALAKALQAEGCDVILGANADFADMAAEHGVDFAAIAPPIKSFLSQPDLDKMVSQGSPAGIPSLLFEGQKMIETAGANAWRMAQGADSIVMNINTSFGIDIAEALGIPPIMTAFLPLHETSEFPLSAYSAPNMGKNLNKLTYTAAFAQQAYYNMPRNKLRKELMGLGPRRAVGFFKDNRGKLLLTLYAYSTAVSPRPTDWPSTSRITGYWPLPDQTNWEPSPEFRAFLDAGPKPVYIGFGSMPFGAERNSKLLRDAVGKWGGRAVIARGWGGIDADALPDSIFAIDQAPHDKLFEYVAAVVHHGGAGTTAAGLRAGRPTLVLPQAMDQPFWGRRVEALGCGPTPIRLSKVTASNLATAIDELTSNRGYAKAADRIGAHLRAEDGASNAAHIISQAVDLLKVPVRA